MSLSIFGGGGLTTALKAQIASVSVYTGAAYPARPSGFGTVIWIGPVDPSTAASDGDLWLDTT